VNELFFFPSNIRSDPRVRRPSAFHRKRIQEDPEVGERKGCGPGPGHLDKLLGIKKKRGRKSKNPVPS
jgi:hypothetical protein